MRGWGTAKLEDIADPSEISWNSQIAIHNMKSLGTPALALCCENRGGVIDGVSSGHAGDGRQRRGFRWEDMPGLSGTR